MVRPIPAVVTIEPLALVRRRRRLTPTQVERASPSRTSAWRLHPPARAPSPPVLELMALAALLGLVAGFGAGVWLQSSHEGAVEPALVSAR